MAFKSWNPVGTWEFTPSYSGFLIPIERLLEFSLIGTTVYRFILIKRKYKIILVSCIAIMILYFSLFTFSKYTLIIPIGALIGIIYTHKLDKDYDEKNS